MTKKSKYFILHGSSLLILLVALSALISQPVQVFAPPPSIYDPGQSLSPYEGSSNYAPGGSGSCGGDGLPRCDDPQFHPRRPSVLIPPRLLVDAAIQISRSCGHMRKSRKSVWKCASILSDGVQ